MLRLQLENVMKAILHFHTPLIMKLSKKENTLTSLNWEEPVRNLDL